MILPGASSRALFAANLAAEACSGKKVLLLAPLGAGKTHALMSIGQSLRAESVPFVFVDLFTAASTPERLLAVLSESVLPFMESEAGSIRALAAEGATSRHHSSPALLGLLELLATRGPSRPFVWLVDEATEIRSLAYFPGLGHIETPFAKALRASRGAILTSSYLGLATDLFPDVEGMSLPGLTSTDVLDVPALRNDDGAIALAITVTGGSAATLLPLVAHMRDSREVARSLVQLLLPGGALELTCRRHYEVLLMRSRGYAVSKRASEVVAGSPNQRLTDLFPSIGRTAGASRQYLRWLVEVGLLTQIKKRYDFADPILGLWAGLYLGRGGHPTEGEIANLVAARVGADHPSAPFDSAQGKPLRDHRPADGTDLPPKRIDRFEEID